MSIKCYHIAESFYNKYISGPIIPIIEKTAITPNMITITNILLSFLTFYLAYNKKLSLVAIMMLIYQALDNLDGNLARYKNLCSKLGATLDVISDFIFYNFIFIFLGINLIPWYKILILILSIDIYGIIATHYIVPRLKKIKIIKRCKLKQFFMDRGVILGIDVGTTDVICSVFLLLNSVNMMYTVVSILWIFDIIYRIIELKYNEFLQIKNC